MNEPEDLPPSLRPEAMIAALRALGPTPYASPETRRRMMAFRERQTMAMAVLRSDLLELAAEFCDAMPEADADAAKRAARTELLICAAVFAEFVCEASSVPFTPAQFACAAFEAAHAVLRDGDKAIGRTPRG